MKQLRVLVAEDNPDHRFLTVRALQASDPTVDVSTVADGDELLDYLHGRDPYAERVLPHVIFLDLRMPRRDGLEVLAEVKALPQLSSIPIVVLTSSDRPEDVDAAYGRGSNAYVTKPRRRTLLRDELAAITGYWTARVKLPEPAG